MKKLLMIIIVNGLFFISCSKDDGDQQTSYVNIKETTNRFRLAEDFTDDGVENFIERPESETPYICALYYKGAEKKVILYSKDSNGNEVFLDSFDVDSEKTNGDLICHNQNLKCTFRFFDGEVHQIYKYSIGFRKVRYFRI